jgi:hypothetical protein
MRKTLFVLAAALLAPLAAAHHSFAIYDMQTEVEFVGVVDTLKFRNPHMSMTLRETGGEQRVINFVEGAPANMLVRMGFDPKVIQPGEKITAIGSPRRDDPDAYFLKSVILEDGTRYDALRPGQSR